MDKVAQVASGDWNSVLTGRLDGWRAAVWMLGEHPFTGVGMGAYRTEFIPAKTALLRRGVAFFDEQVNIVFANAHNELLEVAAETGWPGLAALVLGLVLLARRLRGARHAARPSRSPGRGSPDSVSWRSPTFRSASRWRSGRPASFSPGCSRRRGAGMKVVQRFLLPALLACLVAVQVQRSSGLMRAQRLLYGVERRTMVMLRSGDLDKVKLRGNLEALADARSSIRPRSRLSP